MGVEEQNGAKHKVFLLPRGDALVHDLNLTAQERAQNNCVRVNKSSPAISNVVDDLEYLLAHYLSRDQNTSGERRTDSVAHSGPSSPTPNPRSSTATTTSRPPPRRLTE